MAKLWRWWWSLLFAGGLCLIWHEAWAPQYVWLHLVIATALIRLLQNSEPENRTTFRMKLLNIWNGTALLALMALSLVFVFLQLRMAVYPQLALSGPGDYGIEKMQGVNALAPRADKVRKQAPRVKKETPVVGKTSVQPFAEKLRVQKRAYLQAEPEAAVQTGPGIPHWRWKTVSIDYGQIDGEHKVILRLLSPVVNALLCMVRVALLLLLVFRFLKISSVDFFCFRKNVRKEVAGFILVVSVMAGGIMAAPADAAFPAQPLLDELETRLTAPDDCFPHCADIADARIKIDSALKAGEGASTILIELEIHAAVKTAVPLPSGVGTWRPDYQVLDGRPHRAVVNHAEHLWTWIPAGVHHLVVSGAIKDNKEQIRVTFPLQPRFVGVHAPGWEIRGLDDAHQVRQMLVLTRETVKKNDSVKETQTPLTTDEPSGLSDFLQVRRHLLLGLEWRVITEVERLAVYPDQKAIVASIPLLKDERVRSEFLKIRDHSARIEMGPDVNRIQWLSSLPISSMLELKVPATAEWAEVWHMDASSLWHYDVKGIPRVYRDHQSGVSWYPWPGEQLNLNIMKLPSAGGRSLTIDAARMDYYPAQEYHRIVLKLVVRTSQGEPYPLEGPGNARLKHARINGRSLPVAASADRLMLPLKPGRQEIEIEWRQSSRMPSAWFSRILAPQQLMSPGVDLTHPVNNIDVFWHLPQKFWLLCTLGPRLGPAILFWSYVAVIALAALLLGKFAPSPLKIHQWFLLGLGLATVDVKTIVLVAAWFMAIEWRSKKTPASPILFNVMQLGLILWTFIVAVSLYQAVQNGLLGIPDMQVAGNGSHATLLHWTVDRVEHLLPRPRVFAWSIYVYRGLMFCWSLWLARRTVSWARWAVQALRHNGAWRKRSLKKITIARK